MLSRNWTAYNRSRRAYSGGRDWSSDLTALCRRSHSNYNPAAHKPGKPCWNSEATRANGVTKRPLSTDEREQLQLQMELAERTGDLARYCNARAALKAGK